MDVWINKNKQNRKQTKKKKWEYFLINWIFKKNENK